LPLVSPLLLVLLRLRLRPPRALLLLLLLSPRLPLLLQQLAVLVRPLPVRQAWLSGRPPLP
jgi:hypothetical protein